MFNSRNNMVAIEDKILSFQKENEEAQQVIQLGSDEHLDLLLRIKKAVDPLTARFDVLINDLIPTTNRLDPEKINNILPSLLDLYSTAIKLVAILKRSRIANQIKSSTQDYYSQVENLREFIYDLENFRSNDDNELDGILGELNTL